ncbi:MAG: hypothetical protein GY801_16705 [bacterium]|nr:hypothetical protein [bacterium]
MDLPAHVAAGALTASIILYAESKHNRDRGDRTYMVKLGMACFLWGTLEHLILDALPHYDWLFKVTFFKPLPYYWMHPQILTTVPVLIAAFILMKDYWMIAVISVLGGVYPDIEKLAYLDLHIPKFFVLFRRHSCSLSGRPWEYAHKDFLIVTEICVFVLMMGGMWWFAKHRQNRQNCFIPPVSLDSLKQLGKGRLWGTRFMGS